MREKSRLTGIRDKGNAVDNPDQNLSKKGKERYKLWDTRLDAAWLFRGPGLCQRVSTCGRALGGWGRLGAVEANEIKGAFINSSFASRAVLDRTFQGSKGIARLGCGIVSQ